MFITFVIMDYKKKYMEALERAKKMLASKRSVIVEKQALETIFPELAESEDEKIREWCISHFKAAFRVSKNNVEYQEYLNNKVIPWLEKQGKQTETNLVEILKHFPRETELYSPLYGKLWLAEVDEEHEIITCYKYRLEEGCTRATLEQENTVSFYSNGTTGLPDCTTSKDCMLFLYDIEKQGEKANPYSGISFEYNGHTWGMCARDNGVDILFDCELINHLEKPCEQKFTDKVESKFKVGDWLKYRSAEPFLVEEITEQGYINGNSCLPFEWENEIRLWTVQDAKEEDVLVDVYGNIGIYLRHTGFDWRSYCSFGRRVGFQPFIVNHEIEGTHPATPTQRDLLFQKMEEDGYMWDSHAKMLICSTDMESK